MRITPVTPPNTCNYNQALASSVITQGFLRWDPAVNPQADPGYLGGDAGTLHPIVGGINSTFTIAQGTGPGAVPVPGATTNLFTVAGRLAGPRARTSASSTERSSSPAECATSSRSPTVIVVG